MQHKYIYIVYDAISSSFRKNARNTGQIRTETSHLESFTWRWRMNVNSRTTCSVRYNWRTKRYHMLAMLWYRLRCVKYRYCTFLSNLKNYQRRRHGHNHEQVKLTTSLYHTLTDTSYHITTFLTDDKTLWILLHFQDWHRYTIATPSHYSL